MMPNIEQEDIFIEKAYYLKQKFEVNKQYSLFLKDSEKNKVPIDGLHIYIDNVWNIIKGNKDLNLSV